MNDLNNDIYLYGIKKGGNDSDDDVLIHKYKPSRCVIMPGNKIKTAWDIIIIFLLIYTATFVPYQVAFIDDVSTTLYVIMTFLDVLFIIDLPIQFITAYEISNRMIEVRLRYIALHYIKTWFFFDLLACFPSQIIELVWSGKGGYNWLVRLARLPRLYWLIRIFRIFKMIKLVK